jgi:tetratricopeptide (TPR) repeat protein
LRRRRGTVLAAAALLATLLLGIAGTSVGLLRALEAESKARVEAERARQAQEEAETVASFLTGLFRAADPQREDRSDVTALEVLERGAAKVEEEFQDQPLLRARLLSTISGVFRSLGRYERGLELSDKALEVHRAHLPPNDPGVIHDLQMLGSLHRSLGDLETAEAIHKQGLEAAETAQDQDPDLLAELLKELAVTYLIERQFQKAEPLLRRAIALEEKTESQQLPYSLVKLGASLADEKGRQEEAENLLLRGLEIWSRAPAGNELNMAKVKNNLGRLMQNHGQRYERAETYYEESLETRRRILGPDHPDVARTQVNLASLRLAQGRQEEAERILREVLPRVRKTLGEEHFEVARVLHSLAVVLAAEGRRNEAAAAFRRALEIRRKVFPEDHPEIQVTLRNLEKLNSP